MKRDSKQILNIFFRYIIIVLVAIPNLYLFYLAFTPLTVYPVFLILNFFYDASLNGTTILINSSIPIELIDACIAGAAYYLLFILNMSVPNMKLEKRAKLVLISFASLLLLNILRIVILSFMHINGSEFFDIAHKLFWYALSIVFVLVIWFSETKIFKIKEIPFYTDLKFLYKLTKRK